MIKVIHNIFIISLLLSCILGNRPVIHVDKHMQNDMSKDGLNVDHSFHIRIRASKQAFPKKGVKTQQEQIRNSNLEDDQDSDIEPGSISGTIQVSIIRNNTVDNGSSCDDVLNNPEFVQCIPAEPHNIDVESSGHYTDRKFLSTDLLQSMEQPSPLADKSVFRKRYEELNLKPDFFEAVALLLNHVRKIGLNIDDKSLVDLPVKRITEFEEFKMEVMKFISDNPKMTKCTEDKYKKLLLRFFASCDDEIIPVKSGYTIGGAVQENLAKLSPDDKLNKVIDNVAKSFNSILLRKFESYNYPTSENIHLTILSETDLSRFFSILYKHLENGDPAPWYLSESFPWEASTKRWKSTILPLPHEHIIPGERFKEYYYWDSYWILKGLIANGDFHQASNILENYMYIVDTYGFIPNGGRYYYLDRSQPPLFSEMAGTYYSALMAENKSFTANEFLIQALPRMIIEYIGFWMNPKSGHIVDVEQGSQKSPTGKAQTFRDIARNPQESHFLNRYHSFVEHPRLESYSHDHAVFEHVKNLYGLDKAKYIMRCIRAAAESGWDFSSRWKDSVARDNEKPQKLEHVKFFEDLNTLNILPADLNAYLFQAEKRIIEFLSVDKWKSIEGAEQIYKLMNQLHQKRSSTMRKYMRTDSSFVDLLWDSKEHSKSINAGSVTANVIIDSSHKVDPRIKTKFGIVTTNLRTNQQWDMPNLWAPLQTIVLDAHPRYKENKDDALYLEYRNARNFVNHAIASTNDSLYYEKYSIDGGSGIGGEYSVQRGFGWTNGLILETFGYGSLSQPSSI